MPTFNPDGTYNSNPTGGLLSGARRRQRPREPYTDAQVDDTPPAAPADATPAAPAATVPAVPQAEAAAPAATPAAPAAPVTQTYTPGDTYDVEDASVTTQLDRILSSGSPTLTAAETRGKAAANRRGLLNSSMGAQAGQAALIDAALPIASQEAAQIQARNLAGMGIASNQKIADSNTAAFNREKTAAAIAAFDNSYADAFRTIAQNENLPAAARDSYLTHIGLIKDSNINLLEQIYGIDLEWASTPAAAA